MKALFIISNFRGGGAQKAVRDMAALLKQRGHNVNLILLEHGIEHSLPEGVAIHSVVKPGRPLPGGFVGKWLLAIKLRRLHDKLSQSKPFDLVISTLPLTDEIVRMARLKNVWFRIANTLSAEIDQLSNNDRRKSKRRKRRYQRLYQDQRLIAVSEGVAQDIHTRMQIRTKALRVVSNPIDFEFARRQAQQPDSSIPDTPYLIHVGSFAKAKRHDLLLDAFALSKQKDILVLLVQPSADLQRMIDSRKLTNRVVVAGFKKNPFPWIARAKALLLTSDYEGMPNVIVEALICGTPVISTDCPSGPREILVGENSKWLSPVGDARSFASNIERLYQVPYCIDLTKVERFHSLHAIRLIEQLAR